MSATFFRGNSRGRMPEAFGLLSEDQQAGHENVIADLPEIRWVAIWGAGEGETVSLATTMGVVGRAAWNGNPEAWSPKQSKQMILTWKRLCKLGFIPTSKRNYDAHRRHNGGKRK